MAQGNGTEDYTRLLAVRQEELVWRISELSLAHEERLRLVTTQERRIHELESVVERVMRRLPVRLYRRLRSLRPRDAHGSTVIDAPPSTPTDDESAPHAGKSDFSRLALVIDAVNAGPDHPALDSLAPALRALGGDVRAIVSEEGDPRRHSGNGLEGAAPLPVAQRVVWAERQNRAIEGIDADMYCFVDSRVEIRPDVIERLVSALMTTRGCGAAGPLLLSAERVVEAAGGIMWRDGLLSAYGRGLDERAPEVNFRHPVDFCPPGVLLVDAHDFRAVGGFDPTFHTDIAAMAHLCLGIGQSGRQVVLEPAARAIGDALWTEPVPPSDRLRLVDQLMPDAARAAPSVVGDLVWRDRRSGTRILVVDDRLPESRMGSGFPRMRALLSALVRSGYVVAFLPVLDPAPHQPLTGELQAEGVEVLYDIYDVQGKVRRRVPAVGAVVVSRPHNAWLIPLIRDVNPDVGVLYDAEAIFAARGGNGDDSAVADEDVERQIRDEVGLAASADLVLTVSEAEAGTFQRHRPHVRTLVWGHALSVIPPVASFDQRHDLAFVGYLGNAPNEAALLMLLEHIFPVVRRQIDVQLLVAGTNASPRVLDAARRQGKAVHLLGYVEDLTEVFERSRVFAAPHRVAAGIPLKVVEAMAHGVPCVISPLLAVQLDVRSGDEVVTADTPEEFAQQIVELYRSRARWESMQRAGLRFVEDHYDPERQRETLDRAFQEVIRSRDVTVPW